MNILIGNKLKILRKNKGMSQEEAADYLHISQSAYARMESGESSSWVNHIFKICKIFDIAPEELLKIERNPKEAASSDGTIQISGTVIEQYEERIKDLKKIIKDLKANKKLQ
ncbi:helix-turn-helix transcriptional regulator [Flavobacterium sp. LC2016-12]|uniref:helix-turn-helix transcriptional regulator n=1 Tax=Flavobacterium sp. LC2016-12 TaxID=2783794 RepID=UPI00188C8659|nr:helix-turn-helix transcriptional regulator [Flavobacterium sp. LC2016-12]MBF4465887.1 helix-turn-helix transcriptional regulator [Flavobacterium sp. LC2016-12]